LLDLCLSWETEWWSSSAHRYLPWWLLRRTVFAPWKKSMTVSLLFPWQRSCWKNGCSAVFAQRDHQRMLEFSFSSKPICFTSLSHLSLSLFWSSHPRASSQAPDKEFLVATGEGTQKVEKSRELRDKERRFVVTTAAAGAIGSGWEISREEEENNRQTEQCGLRELSSQSPLQSFAERRHTCRWGRPILSISFKNTTTKRPTTYDR
jgi:hypothetical protein